MSREVDRRNFSVNKITSVRETELHSLASGVSETLPGAHRVRIASFDAVTGNPAVVASESAPAERGNYIQRALDHLRSISGILGFAATQPAEFVADPHIQQASSGAVAVHLQQQYKGIPIFQAAETVRFSPDGTLKETAGSSVTVAQEVTVSPKLSVQDAVLKAAQHVAVPHPDERGATDSFGQPLPLTTVDLTGFVPKIIATFPNKPDQPTVLEAGPFGDKIKASLIWFPMDSELRLAWEVIVTMPNYDGQYRTMVDAANGEILYCRQLVLSVAARGNVYRVNGASARQITDFPRPLADYGLPIPGGLPSGFPDDWVSVNSAAGNSVNTHLGDSGPTIQGTVQSGILTFNPADPVGDDQKVLNIFYLNCYMHDYFYLLGFKEADGNFQQDNFGRGGAPSDRVDARSYSGAVWGTASMGTPVDGSSPTMKMGLVTSTNRHTAFDSTVVFHEFMHGVTNRLVGGPMNVHALDADQSGGMGEGWGDYIACTINNTTVVGAWVVNQAGGIRVFPYDSNFPDHFGNLGTGRYTEVHNIGEIWCATLMEMNRKIGATLGVQLVVDALKLSPANPSFLDMRDSILSALDNKLAAGQLSSSAHATARSGIWTAFAKFGMGPGARSNGASLSGIAADFNTPADTTRPSVRVEATPNLAIPDNQPAGVTHTLTVPQAGGVTRLTVSIDIEHTFIGDLHVSLTTPKGSTVILHNRSGGSTDNLVKSYTSEDTPALAALAGEQAQGGWTLKVADLAGVDIGKLKKWSLDIGLESTPQVVRGEATPALTIPDNDPTGVSSAIAIAQSGTARNIKVSVDITHTYIGDLRVVLVAPSGQQAILHNQTCGSQDNLIKTYDSTSTPALAALVGQVIQGNWVLRVTDLAGQDIGKLNRWSLDIGLESTPQVVRGEATPALTIPDNDPTGVSSAIAIVQSGTARDIKASVDITHTYIGDLRVVLVAPSGQ
ncbi:M36 family metallopeptidase, partial [Candidatus Poribacteria bacterium]|nr:M36 family metallopeptidase [Candidatus Poribacteria bacterium]